MRLTRISLPPTLALLMTSSVAAQVPCQTTDSIMQCWDRAFAAVEAPTEPEKAAQASASKVLLAKEPVGADTGGENLAANKKSLLPLLSLSGLLGDSLETGNDGTYVIDFSPLLFPGQDKDFQLQAVFKTELELAGAVTDALPAASRDEQTKELLGDLGDLADYTVTLTYNPTARRFGRGFEQYRPLFMALTDHATAGERPSLQQLLAVLSTIDVGVGQLDDSDVNAPIADLTVNGQKLSETQRQNLRIAVSTQAWQLAQRQRDLTIAMKAAHLDDFHELVDNQRQLYFSAQRRLRDPLIGGDQLSLKLTYEWSGINLNRAIDKGCATTLRSASEAAAVDPCFHSYVTYMNENASQIDGANRFSFSGEYVDIDAAKADLAPVGLATIDLAAAKKLVISAGWGRELLGPDGTPITLDFMLSHQDVSDDPMRQDRTLATLTLTRKFGQVDIPFGIVYANHGEYLTDVDEKLSAHIGLRFSALAPKKEK